MSPFQVGRPFDLRAEGARPVPDPSKGCPAGQCPAGRMRAPESIGNNTRVARPAIGRAGLQHPGNYPGPGTQSLCPVRPLTRPTMLARFTPPPTPLR
ncbi:hypothetical protein TcasGA2_TC008362 [Tribolium castaneum]|uniref:Uncharacterized protein n=1 Tax=Tribolium castaneum TaxID=7070 RepID=D2A1B5_TRICA|nr:hypothetical protein TcasGA2_TC008362 [Tribolium castaneum]